MESHDILWTEFQARLARYLDEERIADSSDETLIPIPDKSYAQELLELPIPLESRVAHLIPHEEPITELLTADLIAKRIGADEYWVKHTARYIGLEPLTDRSTAGANLYPPLSEELLNEEWQWYRRYSELDPYLSPYALSRFIARSQVWVEAMANELGVYPRFVATSEKMLRPQYPKELIKLLRHLIFIVPLAGDWVTVDTIAAESGRNKDTVKKVLAQKGMQFDRRRSPVNGRISQHYPSEAIAAAKQGPAPAGDWLTVGAIARQLGASEDWVGDTVKAHFLERGEERLDDYHMKRVHYPPTIAETLKIELEKYTYLPGWETAPGIGLRLNKSTDWVVTHIADDYTDSGRRMYDGTRKLSTYYPPEVVQALEIEAMKVAAYPEAGEYMTLTELAHVLGKSKLWIENRIPYTNMQAEKRLDKINRPLNHYPPEIVNALRQLPPDILRQHR